MKNFSKVVLMALAFLGMNASAQNYAEKKGENKYRFSYLAMNGEFKMASKNAETINDKRNPSIILLSTSQKAGTLTKMTFFHHSNENEKLAECGYQYVGSRPDPYYFPNISKSSIWDIFEKVEDYSGKCGDFRYVISRSPHDIPVHMHLRYGGDVEDLLNMSRDTKDDKFNPWWAEYVSADRK